MPDAPVPAPLQVVNRTVGTYAFRFDAPGRPPESDRGPELGDEGYVVVRRHDVRKALNALTMEVKNAHQFGAVDQNDIIAMTRLGDVLR